MLRVLPGPRVPKLCSQQGTLTLFYVLVCSCSLQPFLFSQFDLNLLQKVPLVTCASLPTLHPQPGGRLPPGLCVPSGGH